MQDRPLEDIRIVLVDEDEHQRQLLVWELTGLGFRNVTPLATPIAALEHIADFPTELVIAEYQIGLLKLLRAHPQSPSPDLPVIIISSHADEESVTAARDAGVDEFLVKPVDAEDLYIHIRNTMENRRAFIHDDAFHGPDRRRHPKSITPDKDRRSADD